MFKAVFYRLTKICLKDFRKTDCEQEEKLERIKITYGKTTKA
jgi:hypothetical protein